MPHLEALAVPGRPWELYPETYKLWVLVVSLLSFLPEDEAPFATNYLCGCQWSPLQVLPLCPLFARWLVTAGLLLVLVEVMVVVMGVDLAGVAAVVASVPPT